MHNFLVHQYDLNANPNTYITVFVLLVVVRTLLDPWDICLNFDVKSVFNETILVFFFFDKASREFCTNQRARLKVKEKGIVVVYVNNVKWLVFCLFFLVRISITLNKQQK